MIHLACRSSYSFLKAYGTPEQIVERAIELGAPTVGIADLFSTWAHIPFNKLCKERNIKPIFGVAIPVVLNLEKDARYDLVTLLAKNEDGLQAQYKLLTKAFEQSYYRPRVTWAQLAKIDSNEILINSIAPQNEQQLRLLERPIIAASPFASATLRLALRNQFDVALSASPMYPRPEDEEAYRLMNAVGKGTIAANIDSIEAWMFREGELRRRMLDLGFNKEVFDKSLIITNDLADSLNCAIPTGTNVKPSLDIDIEAWCRSGAKLRGIDLEKEPYKSRYQRELDIIYEKEFSDYFLLVGDLIAWAKSRMFVGPARGSSAGSLVCYLMGIVEVDPIPHGLLFERFIDINRKDLPDIDIDFPDERRDEVFAYVSGKYGDANVARIGTISVFKPKSAINDTGKCYNIPPWETKKLTEIMVERSGGDARSNMCIEDTISQFDIGKELVKTFPKIIMSAKIEGHPRHSGVHAAGIIVSNDDVSKYFAMNARGDTSIAMINKNDAEDIGLLKIDALGLKTLSVIQDCCEQIGKDPKFLYTLPTTIESTFNLFKADKVAGIFQFEGYAVRSLMRQMGVENFNDIVALTALARPGPLHCGAANEFISRRTGVVDWEYEIPQLKPHVEHTYGTIVYQEQVMSITRDLGEMDWQDVSALRKAMSKSLGEEFFNQFKVKFLKGTDKKGIDHAKAEELWNNMCTFGSWAFNLSHAVSYALISYWCAYLKTNWPLEFAVAQLRRTDSEDHVFRLLRELIKEGYEFTPFDIEKSHEGWTQQDGKIFGGFTAIKGIGPVKASKLLKARADGDDNWTDKLTPIERSLLLAPNNTPWHNINRIEKLYGTLYEEPGEYRSENLPNGVSGPINKIEDIKEEVGNYCFIGTLKQRNLRDLNETQSLAKRNGQVMHSNNLFLNLTFEDDSGSVLAVINRYLYNTMGKPLMEEASDGKDFLVRGNIINEGQRKIYIEKIVRLS